MRYTEQALEEQATYKLLDNEEYKHAVQHEVMACVRREKRYGSAAPRDTATRNMIKALRMCPWNNTPVDWARLHVTEAALKSK